jgi:hypothetical protein
MCIFCWLLLSYWLQYLFLLLSFSVQDMLFRIVVLYRGVISMVPSSIVIFFVDLFFPLLVKFPISQKYHWFFPYIPGYHRWYRHEPQKDPSCYVFHVDSASRHLVGGSLADHHSITPVIFAPNYPALNSTRGVLGNVWPVGLNDTHPDKNPKHLHAQMRKRTDKHLRKIPTIK